MSSILSGTTKVLKTGLALKNAAISVLNPVKTIRDVIKKIAIQSFVLIIKQSIDFTLKKKIDSSGNKFFRQLNALTDSNTDMSGLQKDFSFDVTLDTLIEQSNESEEYKVLKYLDVTKLKNKLSSYKNSLRSDFYEYIVENEFINLNTLIDGVNEIFKTPTDIIGCEFVKCSIDVVEHDIKDRNFLLKVNVKLALKSQ